MCLDTTNDNKRLTDLHMKNRKVDPIAKIAMRSRGITVKERRVRFQGEIIVFRYHNDRYDVIVDDVKVDAIITNNINEAIATYKQRKAKI
jgi:hypothetical protein